MTVSFPKGRALSLIRCGGFKWFADHHGLVVVGIGSRVVEGGAEEGDAQRLANVKESVDRKIAVA